MTATGGPASAHPGDPHTRSPQRSLGWSLDLLADLHAGALTERAAARLRPRAIADPQAGPVLAALDATVADLAALSTRYPARMPDVVAQRLDVALATEAQRSDPSSAAGPARVAHHRVAFSRPEIMPALRRRLRARWIGVGALAAATLGVAVTGVLTGTVTSVLTGDPPRAGDALGAAAVSPPAPLTLSSGELGGALNHALAARDYGPLTRADALRRCLDANDVPARAQPLGARQVNLDGRRGVLLVLPTTRAEQFRLLVVGADCRPGHPTRIADTVAPR
ncbi:MAG: hypothetical protein ACRDS1_07380 [Pseudonocardiaceae bacterium]